MIIIKLKSLTTLLLLRDAAVETKDEQDSTSTNEMKQAPNVHSFPAVRREQQVDHMVVQF